MAHREDSRTKEEILDKIILALSKKGLNNLSLREIAKEIGTSGRMIIYYFESYDRLIDSVFIHLSAKHKEILKSVFSENRSRPFNETADIFVHRIYCPENQKTLLLFLELYTKAARQPGKHKLFFKEVLFNWISEIENLIAPEFSRDNASMIISFYRGLMMDWLATGDTERIYSTNSAFTRLISELIKNQSNEYKMEKNNEKYARRKPKNREHSE